MKTWEKILIIIAGVIMTASLVYAVNGDSDNLFNEDDWKETVLNIDRTLYYAPHFTGDLFFNPWIEMDKKGFFTVLKWRFFTEKAMYNNEEESFLPGYTQLTAEFINTHDNFFSWLGHASILIKTSGKIMLFDPVLGDIPFVKKIRIK